MNQHLYSNTFLTLVASWVVAASPYMLQTLWKEEEEESTT